MAVSGSMPRLLIAGLSGGSGKTVVSMGLLLLLRRAGLEVRAFKKGPDYIDAAWLTWAAGAQARNLDTYLMGPYQVSESFAHNATSSGINIIEGNRGLFDGFDAQGTHSSAVLAETISAPVILVIDATKMTRTAAALVLGCQKLDPKLSIRGVILNNVNGRRHEKVLREAIESACGVPILGALPRSMETPVPERHLGLVTPEDHSAMSKLEHCLLEIVDGRIDLPALLAIARSAPELELPRTEAAKNEGALGLKIGYVKDEAFSFYYPENLEQLEQAGAQLVAVSALHSRELPHLHALYIGGGFPETHAEQISANQTFLRSLKTAANAGLPIYAECGGLMLLSRSLVWNDSRYAMASVFDFDVELCPNPQGHGYCELKVDQPNPMFSGGTVLRGHEFHYSRIVGKAIPTAAEVLRGSGCSGKRDLAVFRNVIAGYTHLHALATPEWAHGLIAAAKEHALQAA